jgi:hypothetical protein
VNPRLLSPIKQSDKSYGQAKGTPSMRTKRIFAALLVLPLIATATVAQARARGAPDAAAWGSGGRQVEAPPWSFACMKDTGPTQCGEPMWVYGN